jgi:hypothetical protein
MVLLKGFDADGFAFFSGYESRKGRELAPNPRAALLFYWDPVGRQVRVEGAVGRVTPDETEAYFHSRPRGAQIAALASRQSLPLASRDELEARVRELEAELERVRRRGWADAYEEREPELNAIAAPVWDSRSELAAIVALQGPVPRFGREAARAAVPSLLERTAAISRELGYASRA